MKHTLQATIKTKDGIRTFCLSLENPNPHTKELLDKVFKKSESVKIEDLLYFYISQVEENGKHLDTIASLNAQNQALKEQKEKIDKELEKLNYKLESL